MQVRFSKRSTYTEIIMHHHHHLKNQSFVSDMPKGGILSPLPSPQGPGKIYYTPVFKTLENVFFI